MKNITVRKMSSLPTIPFKELCEKYEANALKSKKDRDVSGLKQSILQLGFSAPLVVWDEGKYITDGAGRILALQMLDYEGYEIPDIPVIKVHAENLKDAKALTLAITSQYGEVTAESAGEFTLDLVGVDLGFVSLPGFNLEDIKITDGQQTDKDTEYEIEEDDAPEAPKVAVSKPGDIYALGSHRVMCGDALDPVAIGKLMNGKKADLLLTDPPYNVAYVGKTKDALTIKNDKMSADKFREFLRGAFSLADRYLKAGGVFYIWHADSEGYNFRGAANDVGWQIRECLIWLKNSLVLGRQDYHWKHEPCLYGWKEGTAHLWNSDRKQTTVLEFDRPTKSKEHPTMKPVKLIAYQMQNSSLEKQIVLDPFGGSGTTLIAADQIGRTCYTMELDPKYVDVIVERWENLTGKKAKKL